MRYYYDMKIKKKLLVLIFGLILLLGGYTVKEIIWGEEPVPAETIENITAGQNVSRIDVVKANESESVNIFWWKPKPNTSWQWQLNGIVNQNYDVDMYDVDLFD